jgi:hypothetical protein
LVVHGRFHGRIVARRTGSAASVLCLLHNVVIRNEICKSVCELLFASITVVVDLNVAVDLAVDFGSFLVVGGRVVM